MGKPVGVESLKTVCQKSALPIYALGGIKIDNCRDTLEAGAHGIALISELIGADSPEQNYYQLQKKLS